MLQDRFVPPRGAFTRSVPVRFSHCDPAGIVDFPHYFDIFNGLIEDWYGEELGYDYAELVMGSRYGFPFVHIECDFKVPSRMGDVIDLTLMVERIGRTSLGIAIVCHQGRHRAAACPHGHRDDVASRRARRCRCRTRCAPSSRPIAGAPPRARSGSGLSSTRSGRHAGERAGRPPDPVRAWSAVPARICAAMTAGGGPSRRSATAWSGVSARHQARRRPRGDWSTLSIRPCASASSRRPRTAPCAGSSQRLCDSSGSSARS